MFAFLLKTIDNIFLLSLLGVSNAVDSLVNLPEPYKSITLQTGGCSGNQTSSLDIYRSESSSSKTVLLITGGAYIKLSLGKIRNALPWYLDAGYTVAVLYYRLCRSSEQHWLVCSNPYEAFDDVKMAMEKIHANIEEYHVDPSKIVMSGFSAGGHLTALYSTLCTKEEIHCPSAVVLHFPYLETGARVFCTDVGKPFKNIDSYDACFPTALVDANTPPTVIFHATGDTVVPVTQSQDFVQSLTNYDIPHEYYEVSGYGHIFAPFNEILALSEGTFSEGDTYAALLDRALSLAPTIVPSLFPTSNSCEACDDSEPEWMVNNGQNCETSNAINTNCNKNQNWIKNKFCRHSCYYAGNGYEGDTCCNKKLNEDTTMVPSLVTSRSCIFCDDIKTTYMIETGKNCASFPNTIKKKCNKHSKWIEEKFCRLTCYMAGNGYEEDVCCNDEA